jgi:hypothetical protein
MSAFLLRSRVAGAALALAAGCATSPQPGVEIGLARVGEVEAVVIDSIPQQVRVIARGMLPDPCTVLGRPRRERFGSEFRFTLPIRREPEAMCIQEVTPFETRFIIPSSDLDERLYSVYVNGVRDDFSILIPPGDEGFYRDPSDDEFEMP